MMADWFGARMNERFRFYRVDYREPAGEPIAEYGNIVQGGSCEFSSYSETGGSCSFAYRGGTAPDKADLVRIVYEFDDIQGNHASAVIGTFIVTSSNIGRTLASDGSVVKSGDVEGVGVLSILQNKRAGYPYTVRAGTRYADALEQLMLDTGLNPNTQYTIGWLQSSTKRIKRDHVFKGGTSFLEIANWLAKGAGKASAYATPMGVIAFYGPMAYADCKAAGRVTVFDQDRFGKVSGGVTWENDSSDSPNAVRLCYEGEDMSLFAYAVADGADYSEAMENVGHRENTLYEDVTELDGTTAAARLKELKERAATRLAQVCGEEKWTTFKHPYYQGMCVTRWGAELDYGGFHREGIVRNLRVELKPGLNTETRLRTATNAAPATVGGGILWQ